MAQYDMFEQHKEKVKILLNKKSIQIDFEDDDTYSDFLTDVDYNDYTLTELQILFTYNTLLQTIAFSPFPVKFTIQIEN